MWECDIDINEIKEIRTRTCVYFGVGAIKKIEDIAKDLKSKGIDKLIHSGKVNFKYVKDAADDVSKIPKKIMEACNNNVDDALKMYKEQYDEIFKDRVGAVVSAITYLPVLAVSNKIYPKIAQKLVNNKNESKPSK